ncbi:MAG: MarR family winged helix-turn-helix transcriptional regulator [Lachnospiraceae bacterium]|jgi:DNA-binding MarR family transcriptional regulator
MAADKYQKLNEKADIMYRFVSMYGDYMRMSHDYGTGEKINMAEVHTLTFIADNPGITITEIAGMWNKTKGAVSQIVTKLEAKGYIEKCKEGNNSKNLHCYATESGQTLSDVHKRYDVEGLNRENQLLRKEFTDSELDAFYKVMERYTEIVLIPDIENKK